MSTTQEKRIIHSVDARSLTQTDNGKSLAIEVSTLTHGGAYDLGQSIQVCNFPSNDDRITFYYHTTRRSYGEITGWDYRPRFGHYTLTIFND